MEPLPTSNRPLTPSVAHQAPPRRLQPDGSTRPALPPAYAELHVVCFTWLAKVVVRFPLKGASVRRSHDHQGAFRRVMTSWCCE